MYRLPIWQANCLKPHFARAARKQNIAAQLLICRLGASSNNRIGPEA